AVDRGDVHDAAPAGVDHAVDEGMGDIEHGVQVGAQHGVPCRFSHLAEGAVARDAGVVHQDVHPVAVGQDAFGHVQAGGLVGHVGAIGAEDVAGVGLCL